MSMNKEKIQLTQSELSLIAGGHPGGGFAEGFADGYNAGLKCKGLHKAGAFVGGFMTGPIGIIKGVKLANHPEKIKFVLPAFENGEQQAKALGYSRMAGGIVSTGLYTSAMIASVAAGIGYAVYKKFK